MKKYDVVIIGAGPGGYVCAIKCAQLGMSVACIDKRQNSQSKEASGAPGGTCLNVGCIPSKALLHSSHKYETVKKHLSEDGISVGEVSLDLNSMLKSKDSKVAALVKGIEGLFKKNNIDYIIGSAEIKSQNTVEIQNPNQFKQTVEASNIVIATGSEVAQFKGIECDEEVIVSSTGALSLKKVPKRMAVIGGGYIGLELGSVWSRLGSEVTVFEYAESLMSSMDKDISKDAKKIFEKQGLKFHLGTAVSGVKRSGVKATVEYSSKISDELRSDDFDVVLISIGRKPYTKNLGLQNVNIETNQHGKIDVNSKFQTSVENIYAIGDVINGPMLAHKAEEEGVAVAEILSGQYGHVDYNIIPGVVYTHPEIASVGKTEQEVKESGRKYKIGKFSFMANSRARAVGETAGFVKLIVSAEEEDIDRIIGAHIIGMNAGDLITELSVAMTYHATAEDIARICHPHPALCEAVKEAALSAFAKPIHS